MELLSNIAHFVAISPVYIAAGIGIQKPRGKHCNDTGKELETLPSVIHTFDTYNPQFTSNKDIFQNELVKKG